MSRFFYFLSFLFMGIFSQVSTAQTMMWNLHDSIIVIKAKMVEQKKEVQVKKSWLSLYKDRLKETRSASEAKKIKGLINALKDSIGLIRPNQSKEIRLLRHVWRTDSLSKIWEANGFPKGYWNDCYGEGKELISFVIWKIQEDKNIDSLMKKKLLHDCSFLLKRGAAGNVALLLEYYGDPDEGQVILLHTVVPLLVPVDVSFGIWWLCEFPQTMNKIHHAKELYRTTGLIFRMKDLPSRKNVNDLAKDEDLLYVRDFIKKLR